MSKFTKDEKEIKLETSKEISVRLEKAVIEIKNSTLQSDLCKLLAQTENQRNEKWIEDFCNLRDHCIKLQIWESFIVKYNLHKGSTAQYA